MKLWVWSERLSYGELGDEAVLELLHRYEVTLGVQVTPALRARDGDALLALIRRAADAGVALALWPLLDDDGAGPWACERNVGAFGDFVGELLDWTAAENAPVPWIAVDLQLPRQQAERYVNASGLGWVFQIIRLMRSNLSRKRFMAASAEFQRLQTRIADYGARTMARSLDHVATDLATGGIVWQDFLETPVTTVTWDRVALTYYGSLVSGGGLTPADAQGLLYQVCQAAQAHYGDRAGVSLGLCGASPGGDEPPGYATPADLQPDVAAALAAGVQDIALADLAGIVRSLEPGAWFDIVRTCEPAPPAAGVTEWARRSSDNRKRMARIFTYFQ